jgi:hypothetical protein
VPVAAVAAVLVTGAGPTANAAGAGAAVSDHLISGSEDSISCLTMARCVAVGVGSRDAQVVALDNGRQTQVTVLPWRAPLTSVSCPSKAGCWAIGMRSSAVELVKIGPTGKVVSTTKVAVPAGDALTRIWCRTMTDCEIYGTNGQYFYQSDVFFSPWNGKKWRLDAFAGVVGSGFSCWQTTCVIVGFEQFTSSTGAAVAWTFHNGVAGAQNFKGLMTRFSSVSCVSASTCYALGSSHSAGVEVTITNGVPSATNNPVPGLGSPLACVRATCWMIYGSQIVTLRGGLATGAQLTDTEAAGFDGISVHGNGFIAVGASTKRGESDVLVG